MRLLELRAVQAVLALSEAVVHALVKPVVASKIDLLVKRCCVAGAEVCIGNPLMMIV